LSTGDVITEPAVPDVASVAEAIGTGAADTVIAASVATQRIRAPVRRRPPIGYLTVLE
jgi:hypothetical protein